MALGTSPKDISKLLENYSEEQIREMFANQNNVSSFNTNGIEWDFSAPKGVSMGDFAAQSALSQTAPFQSNAKALGYGQNTLNVPGVSAPKAASAFSVSPDQVGYANKYGLTPQQGSQVSSAAIGADGQSLGFGGQISDYTSDNYGDGRWNILDTNQQAMPFSSQQIAGADGVEGLNMAEANNLTSQTNQAGQFDFTGAANLGLSAFNAYNNYNYQKDMMDIYKTDMSNKWADTDRRNKTREAWGSAFANAGKK